MSAHPPSPLTDRLFESLAASHRAAFERLARRFTRNAEEAEDLLQETLVDAYRGFHGFRPDTHFYSWVARIMANNHLDRVRRKRHPVVSLDQPTENDRPVALDLPDEAANPERLLLHEALDQPYQAALDALQPIHRATVELCDLQGATYEEAAAAEDCPVGTIRSRLHRAHKALRGFLERLAPEPAPQPRAHSRRAFLQMGTAMAAGAAIGQIGSEAAEGPSGVVIWGGAEEAEALRAALHQDGRVEPRAETDPATLSAALPGAAALVCLGRPLPGGLARAVADRVRDGMGFVSLGGNLAENPLAALLEVDPGWTPRPLDVEAAVAITAPRHPIARELEDFTVRAGTLSAGPLPTTRPEIVVLATAGPGEATPVGAAWTRGRGRVFYLRTPLPALVPATARRIARNAVRWVSAPDVRR